MRSWRNTRMTATCVVIANTARKIETCRTGCSRRSTGDISLTNARALAIKAVCEKYAIPANAIPQLPKKMRTRMLALLRRGLSLLYERCWSRAAVPVDAVYGRAVGRPTVNAFFKLRMGAA